MVYKSKHFDLVARGFSRNGVPVAHDHALGEIPLDSHTKDLQGDDEGQRSSFIVNLVQDGRGAWHLLREPKL